MLEIEVPEYLPRIAHARFIQAPMQVQVYFRGNETIAPVSSPMTPSPQPARTVFASLEDFTKGTIEIINDDPRHYTFSNIFEVAAGAKPYVKTVVAKNLEYVIEVIRAEGDSPWFAASHDEFALVMDGVVEFELLNLDAAANVAQDVLGSVQFDERPPGPLMGRMRLHRGHQALLQSGAAYRMRAADRAGVVVLQTMRGALSVERWNEICLK